MIRESNAFFLLSSVISWVSLLFTLGGFVLCLSNRRILPKIWLMSLGFAGLFLGGLWYRVVFPLFTRGGGTGDLLGFLLFIGSAINLASWGMLVWGLSVVISEVRQRLSPKEDPVDELF